MSLDAANLFDPLHREVPRDTWDRVREGTPAYGDEPQPSDEDGPSPMRRALLAAAVALVVVGLAGAVAVGARGGDESPVADRTTPGQEACQLEITVENVGQFVRADSSELIEAEKLTSLGSTRIMRAQDGDLVVEVISGRFTAEAFHTASMPDDDWKPELLGNAVSTAAPVADPAADCTIFGIYAAGSGDEGNADAAAATVAALTTR